MAASPIRNVVLVGAHSYLAREFAARHRDVVLRAIRHEEIDQAEAFVSAQCVVNFAFAPQLHSQPYAESLDLDSRVARHANALGIHYVMISSRRVYQEGMQWNASESQNVSGHDTYGRNKVEVELRLARILGDALTILRPANVFGYEPIAGRQRFGAYLQNQLLDTGLIRLTVSPRTRRDLVPVGFFCRVVREIALRRISGTFNVGSGTATEIGQAARWLIAGYGSGELSSESPERADEFLLDVARLEGILGLRCRTGEIETSLRDIGRRLATQRQSPER